MLGNGIGKRIGDSNIFSQGHSFKRPYLDSAFQIIFFPLFKKCTRDATDAFPDASIVYYSCKK